ASAAAFLAVGIAISLLARLDIRTTAGALRGVLVVAIMFGAFQVWQQGLAGGAEVIGDLFALVILATIFTATTSINDMLDTITRWLQPYRRFGANPDKIALAFALMMRSVPGTLEIAQETRFAAKARGLDRSSRALLIPMVIRTVARAHDTGAALTARGIGDE
ncbi:MAG: energy-coupling factor transporter transmembrane component T, partial [Aeromicrobium sp.]